MTTAENSILEGMVERALASLGEEIVPNTKRVSEEDAKAETEDEREDEKEEEGFAKKEEAGDEERPAKRARTKRSEESHRGLDVEGRSEPWYPPGYGGYGYGARGSYGYSGSNRYGRGGYYGRDYGYG